jgi:hypothetical protein
MSVAGLSHQCILPMEQFSCLRLAEVAGPHAIMVHARVLSSWANFPCIASRGVGAGRLLCSVKGITGASMMVGHGKVSSRDNEKGKKYHR